MLRVQLCYLILLLSCEVEHEGVERIGCGQLSHLHLLCDQVEQVLEEFTVIFPVTAAQLGVHQGHQCLRLVHIELKGLLIVLESFVELSFELEDVAKTADAA